MKLCLEKQAEVFSAKMLKRYHADISYKFHISIFSTFYFRFLVIIIYYKENVTFFTEHHINALNPIQDTLCVLQ
jgi:hypothetical protein